MSERSRDDAKRAQVQKAVDSFVARKATEEDFTMLRDRELMTFATGKQCCEFIKAVPKQTDPVRVDVMFAVAEMLRIRWEQSPAHNKKETPRLPNGRTTFRAPPGWR
jgi:hypothetical protein